MRNTDKVRAVLDSTTLSAIGDLCPRPPSYMSSSVGYRTYQTLFYYLTNTAQLCNQVFHAASVEHLKAICWRTDLCGPFKRGNDLVDSSDRLHPIGVLLLLNLIQSLSRKNCGGSQTRQRWEPYVKEPRSKCIRKKILEPSWLPAWHEVLRQASGSVEHAGCWHSSH